MNISWFKRVVFFSGLALALGGCESVGTIQGVSDGRPVQLEYEQGFFDKDGQLKITMQDGERFTGKLVQRSSSTSGDSWEIGESSNDDSWILLGSTTTSSLAEALLISDKGNTMTCQFQLSNPDGGIDGGGIGKCETSDGRKVHATF